MYSNSNVLLFSSIIFLSKASRIDNEEVFLIWISSKVTMILAKS